jgi:hypothetical protein
LQGAAGSFNGSFSIGAASNAGLTNGQTPTNVLSFVNVGIPTNCTNPNIYMPRTTTAGQVIILMAADSGSTCGFNTYTTQGSSDSFFAPGLTDTPQGNSWGLEYGQVKFISDGLGHWYNW